MQKINLIAQGVLELSHREKCGLRRLRRRHPSGLNYSPQRNLFRRGQKKDLTSKKSTIRAYSDKQDVVSLILSCYPDILGFLSAYYFVALLLFAFT